MRTTQPTRCSCSRTVGSPASLVRPYAVRGAGTLFWIWLAGMAVEDVVGGQLDQGGATGGARRGHRGSRRPARSQDFCPRVRRLSGHLATHLDSEIVTATDVTAGNSGDAEAAEDLLADVLPGAGTEEGAQPGTLQVSAVYGDAAYSADELPGGVEDAGFNIGIKG